MNRKQFLIITMISFLSVLFWISFDLYHTASTTTVTSLQEAQIAPLTPTFDNDIIREIKSRNQ